VLVWFCVSTCMYEQTPLAEYQAVGVPGRPLDALPEPEWKQVLREDGRQQRRAVGEG